MARLRASWRTSLPVVQQPRNPQSESIARSPYDSTSDRGLATRQLDNKAECGGDGKAHNGQNRFEDGPRLQSLLDRDAEVARNDPEPTVVHVRGDDRAGRDCDDEQRGVGLREVSGNDQ